VLQGFGSGSSKINHKIWLKQAGYGSLKKRRRHGNADLLAQ
jgi:hypothetical protein